MAKFNVGDRVRCLGGVKITHEETGGSTGDWTGREGVVIHVSKNNEVIEVILDDPAYLSHKWGYSRRDGHWRLPADNFTAIPADETMEQEMEQELLWRHRPALYEGGIVKFTVGDRVRFIKGTSVGSQWDGREGVVIKVERGAILHVMLDNFPCSFRSDGHWQFNSGSFELAAPWFEAALAEALAPLFNQLKTGASDKSS